MNWIRCFNVLHVGSDTSRWAKFRVIWAILALAYTPSIGSVLEWIFWGTVVALCLIVDAVWQYTWWGETTDGAEPLSPA